MRHEPAFVLNQQAVQRGLKNRGYRCAAELARALGIHRNTVSGYLSGAPALPEVLERICVELELSPEEVLVQAKPRRRVPAKEICGLLVKLNTRAPACAFVLFGSRARGKAKPYSDYDIGVYQAGGLSFTEFSRLLDLAGEWNENNLTTAQLVSLNAADLSFLKSVRDDLIFLGGSLESWHALLERCGCAVYE